MDPSSSPAEDSQWEKADRYFSRLPGCFPYIASEASSTHFVIQFCFLLPHKSKSVCEVTLIENTCVSCAENGFFCFCKFMNSKQLGVLNLEEHRWKTLLGLCRQRILKLKWLICFKDLEDLFIHFLHPLPLFCVLGPRGWSQSQLSSDEGEDRAWTILYRRLSFAR